MNAKKSTDPHEPENKIMKGNEIIESILNCLSMKNLTAQEAKYLLGETADEVDRRAKL